MTPYPYQEADIARLVENDGTGLVVTQVGGGKTLVAVEAVRRLGKRAVMVIAPQSTHEYGWRRHVEEQYGEDKVRRIDSSLKGKAALNDLKWGVEGWYICTPQWFARQQWKDIHPDQVIFDEIHVAGAYENTTRKKLHTLKSPARMGLSGTPFRNKIENAWGICSWIQPNSMPRPYYEWRFMDLDTVYDRFAPMNRRVIGEKEPGTIVSRLDCYIQHMQRQRCCEYHPAGFLAALEEPEIEVRTVQMTPAQKKFYVNMEKSYVAWLTTPDENGQLPVVAELPIVARHMLRFCAFAVPSYDPDRDKIYFEPNADSPKIDELLKVLDELEDDTVLVFTHSQQAAHLITHRLTLEGISAFEWSGKISQTKRDEAREKFIAGEIRVVVGVIAAMGTGTDGFQLATNTEVWISESDDPTDNQQGQGRADRPGQTTRVSRIYIRAEGTHDVGVYSKGLETALKMSASLRKKR